MSEQLAQDLATLRAFDELDRPSAESVVAKLRAHVQASDGPMPLVTAAGAGLASTAMTVWAATLLAGVIVIVIALHVPFDWYVERPLLLYRLRGAHDELPLIDLTAAAIMGSFAAMLVRSHTPQRSVVALALRIAGPASFIMLATVVGALSGGTWLLSTPHGVDVVVDRVRDLTFIVSAIIALSVVVAIFRSRVNRVLTGTFVRRLAFVGAVLGLVACVVITPASVSSSTLTMLTVWIAATTFVATFGFVAK